MITIIICIIIKYIMYTTDKYYKYYNRENILETMFFSFVIGGLCFGMPIAFYLDMDTEYQETTLQIVSLKDNNSINARHTLTRTIAEGKMKLSFYTKNKDVYSLMYVDSEDAKIIYGNKNTVTIKEKVTQDTIKNKFALDADIGKKTYLFNIKKGSIKEEFVLDSM